MRNTCEGDNIKLNTTAPYHPAFSGVAERVIGILTNAVCPSQLGPAEIPLGGSLQHSNIH